MRAIFLCVISLLLAIQNSAMPAYSGKIDVGNQTYVRLFGDEHCKWAETEDGYTVVQNERQEWCYAILAPDSSLVPSVWQVGKVTSEDVGFEKFLGAVPKHLVTGNQHRYHSKENVSVSKKPAIGERRILVILMAYKDYPFKSDVAEFDSLFNQEGYNADGARGSVRDFYLSASYHQLHLASDLYGPYTSAYEMQYYGRNTSRNQGDANAYELFKEAITLVGQEANLAQYDGDNDGFIDNVHIIFAGYGEEAGAPANAIWSHEATFSQPFVIQGLKIDRYSCAPELRGNRGNGISRIGPHCHEIGHALGAMDYYDTDYDNNGEFSGTGKWDVMANGSWNNEGITPADFNPYVKANDFGWVNLQALPPGLVTIAPSYYGADNYYILGSYEHGDYYLLENRSKEGWGTDLPGEGLLIFHVHPDIKDARNNINSCAPQKCYIVCASSKYGKPDGTAASYGNINSSGCPYPGAASNKNFGQSSTPMAFFWDGELCRIELNDISQEANGFISLQNNSSVPPDDSIVTGNSLLFEGFEETENMQVEVVGKEGWQITENQDQGKDISNMLVAYEGTKYLQLSAIHSSVAVTDTLTFRCPKLGKGQARVKLFMASLFQQFGNANTIEIGYRLTDDLKWTFENVANPKNGQWKEVVVELSCQVDSCFMLIGTAQPNSILAIDNLEIEQEEHGQSAVDMKPHHIVSTKTFTLDGMMSVRRSNRLIVIRMPDGSHRKKIIRNK